MKKYPECFPANFEAEILPKGAKEENKSVYRVIKYGTINRESFISTYEEMQRKLIPPKKKLDLNNPGTYQLTSEREERLDTHVDWWVYEEAEPQLYFEEVKKDE